MKIETRQTDDKGLGIFANAILPAGLVLERCPIIKITREERRDLKGGRLGEYPFVDREAWAKLPDHQKHLCPGFLAWGLMSLANHSFTPNARVYTLETSDGPIAVLETLRAIYPDEEIEIGYPDVSDYAGDWTVAPDGLANHGPELAVQDRSIRVLEPAAGFRSVPLHKLRDIRKDERS